MGERTTAELEAALGDFRAAPVQDGRLDLVLRRPAEGEREVLDEARLTFADGVEGDTWKVRGSRRMGVALARDTSVEEAVRKAKAVIAAITVTL